MTTYINELLQEIMQEQKDYNQLAETIKNYIIKNNEDKYMYIIDAIQIAILNSTNKFISFEECENIYFTIKGFESLI